MIDFDKKTRAILSRYIPINEYEFWTNWDCSLSTLDAAEKEIAPMRALIERMVPWLRVYAGSTCTCDSCIEGRSILSDYAEMKKGWEADNAG